MLFSGSFIPRASHQTTDDVSVAAGVTHAEGSWVELIAATSLDADGVWVFAAHPTNGGNYLLDLGLGAAAAEQVLVPNLYLDSPRASEGGACLYCPIRIPKGSRLAARIQGSPGTATTYSLAVALVPSAFGLSPSFGRATDYGTVGASSRGTVCDPGGVANTKTITEIVASTSRPIKAFAVCVGNDANAVVGVATRWGVEIMVGAAAAERVVTGQLLLSATIQADAPYPEWLGPFSAEIPAGARLSARVECIDIDATDRLLALNVIGFD